MYSFGEVTEWLMVTVLKTVVGRLTESSNLSLSAKIVQVKNSPYIGLFYFALESSCYTFVKPPLAPGVSEPSTQFTAANARKAIIRPTIA